jgi:hypothetical protein
VLGSNPRFRRQAHLFYSCSLHAAIMSRQMSSTAALAEVRQIFGRRPKPDRWLRTDLCEVDRVDGEEFIDEIQAGAEPRTYFCSAIPYFNFLSVDAALYLLPEVFSVVAEDSIHLVTFLPLFTLPHGKEVFRSLTSAERQALSLLVLSLREEADHPLPIAMLAEVQEVVEGRKTFLEE